jgi:hypothetical protein
MAANETGHFPNRWYADQTGDLHLNNAALYTNEAGASITANNVNMPTATACFASVNAPNQTVTGNVVVYSGLNANVTANGAAIADATVLSAYISQVQTVATNNNGVRLPASPVVGQQHIVINANAAANLKIYPDVGGQISNLTANVGTNIAFVTGKKIVCVSTGPSQWWFIE